MHHEVELGVVLGNGGSNISESVAMSHVAGYCLALDMTNRIAQVRQHTAYLMKSVLYSLIKKIIMCEVLVLFGTGGPCFMLI